VIDLKTTEKAHFAVRDRLIADYLDRTGKWKFDDMEFLDWLQGQPDHEAYEYYYPSRRRPAAE